MDEPAQGPTSGAFSARRSNLHDAGVVLDPGMADQRLEIERRNDLYLSESKAKVQFEVDNFNRLGAEGTAILGIATTELAIIVGFLSTQRSTLFDGLVAVPVALAAGFLAYFVLFVFQVHDKSSRLPVGPDLHAIAEKMAEVDAVDLKRLIADEYVRQHVEIEYFLERRAHTIGWMTVSLAIETLSFGGAVILALLR